MDYAVITATPQALRTFRIGTIISAYEEKGFEILDLSLLTMDQASYHESCDAVDHIPTQTEVSEMLSGRSLVLGVSHRDLPACFKKEGLDALSSRMGCRIHPGSKGLVFWFGRIK